MGLLALELGFMFDEIAYHLSLVLGVV